MRTDQKRIFARVNAQLVSLSENDGVRMSRSSLCMPGLLHRAGPSDSLTMSVDTW